MLRTHTQPTPLYVMDEIDAALDFKNVSIVANYIKVCNNRNSRAIQYVVHTRGKAFVGVHATRRECV